MENLSGAELDEALRREGVDEESLSILRDPSPDYSCAQCSIVVTGGMSKFQSHLQEKYHTSPFKCGESGCHSSYTHRRTLYLHLREHHKAVTNVVTASTASSSQAPPQPLPSSTRTQFNESVCVNPVYDQYEEPVQTAEYWESTASSSDEPFSLGTVGVQPGMGESMAIDTEEEVQEESGLKSAAERAVLHLRSMAYMTTVGIQAVTEQCYSLMQNTASHLKQRVLSYIEKPDEEKNINHLLEEFSIEDPFKELKTKPQQLSCFEKKYGLLRPTEVFLGDAFDSRQHPKRPRLEPTQIHRSYQYVSIKDILQGVMNDPVLRNLILSEKSSSDGYLRSFRDGALFETLPPDLKGAIRVIIYVDDLEVLQALSSRAGAYKIAGLYFGIQNLPAELNSLLNYIFVTALAYADDAKHQEVWDLFLADMKKLETDGLNVVIDGVECNFKVVLVAQIGDTLAAHEVLGLLAPSCNAFCRWCYILRSEMWADGTKKGLLRTPEKHADDIRGCNNKEIRTATGVRGPPLIHGLRFFRGVTSSVPDIFHDLNQGVCKMEVKLALREYVCKQKYLTEKELNERVKYFDYGFADKKNKPSPNFTSKSLNDVSSYNLHQTGAQMWCLVRIFPFLLGDLVPEGDKFFQLICLLNEIMAIVFAHSICENDLQLLEKFILQHHTLFQEIFPGVPEGTLAAQEEEIQQQVDLENSFENPDNPEVVEINVDPNNPENIEVVVNPVNQEGEEEDEEEDRESEDEGNFFNEETVPHDDDIEVQAQATEAGSVKKTRKKEKEKEKKRKPKIIRLINKHHHMLHYVDFIRNFGPLILYWCIRYEAKHYFFKLCATVCHNFKNILKTLMEILQMKIVADRLEPSSRLTMAKRGRKLVYVSEALHRRELSAYGLLPADRVYRVKSVVFNGVDYRPELFVQEGLRTELALPVFSCIKAVYVSVCEKHVYLILQKWQTVGYDAHYCAYPVTPLKVYATVKEAHSFPSYRLLSPWTRYDSETVYLAPRTIS